MGEDAGEKQASLTILLDTHAHTHAVPFQDGANAERNW